MADFSSVLSGLANIGASIANDASGYAPQQNYDIDEASANYNNWLDEKKRFGTDYDTATFVGNGMDYEGANELASSLNQRYIPSEIERRFTDGDGGLALPMGHGITALDLTSQYHSPKPVRDLYESHFAQESGEGSWQDQLGSVSPSNIDDGSAEGREALFMTGDRYRQYINDYGLQGRPVDDIDPDALYSKQDEMEKYGFLPYSENYMSPYTSGFHNQADAQAVNNFFKRLAGLRRENADYTVLDENGNRHSGQDFMKNMSAQGQNLFAQASDSSNSVSDPSLTNEYSVPYTYEDEDRGEIPAPIRAAGETSEGYAVEFENGERWYYPSEQDFDRKVKPSFETDNPVYWLNVDPLTLSDGSKIRYDQVLRISDEIKNGEGEHVNFKNPLLAFTPFGGKNWGKPDVSMPDILGDATLEDLGKWAKNDISPWLADIFLGSVPYFDLRTGVPYGAAKAFSIYNGIEPGADSDGTYRMIAESPDSDLKNSMALGAFITPFTEHLWGPIGKSGISSVASGVRKLLGKPANNVMDNPLRNLLKGSFQEAAEEIPGNLTEELERSGFQDYYKNYAYDDENYEGPTYDRQGRPIRTETSTEEAVHNFVKDIPEAAAGGGALGLIFSGLGYNEYKDKYDKWKADQYNISLEDLPIPDIGDMVIPIERSEYYAGTRR